MFSLFYVIFDFCLDSKNNNINAVEVAKVIEAAGAKMIAVHGRTRNEFYSGKADWDIIADVKKSTENIIRNLTFNDLKIKVMDERREELKALSVVSSDENAVWLIDYWCNKDLRGLIQMPFSRHWIMHTEACLRIKNKLK